MLSGAVAEVKRAITYICVNDVVLNERACRPAIQGEKRIAAGIDGPSVRDCPNINHSIAFVSTVPRRASNRQQCGAITLKQYIYIYVCVYVGTHLAAPVDQPIPATTSTDELVHVSEYVPVPMFIEAPVLASM